jgi:hypothetical protein
MEIVSLQRTRNTISYFDLCLLEGGGGGDPSLWLYGRRDIMHYAIAMHAERERERLREHNQTCQDILADMK